MRLATSSFRVSNHVTTCYLLSITETYSHTTRSTSSVFLTGWMPTTTFTWLDTWQKSCFEGGKSDAGWSEHEALVHAGCLALTYRLVLRENWYMIRSCSGPAHDVHARFCHVRNSIISMRRLRLMLMQSFDPGGWV